MSISVESRIHRTLRKLERFKACDRWQQLSQLKEMYSPLDDRERLLGAYENVSGKTDHLLLFTNVSVHLWENATWRSLKYSDIANTEWVIEPKDEASTLVLRMRSGCHEHLPILGGTEFTRDVFEVMRFFDRVIADIG